MGRITRQENAKKLERWPLTVDLWPSGRPVHRGWEFKKAPRASFFTCSPPYLEDSSHPCFQKSILVRSWTVCRLWSWFWDILRLGFWFETQGFNFWGWFLFDHAPQVWIQPHLRAFRASRWTSSSLVWFLSHLRASFPFFVLWMAPRQETSTSRAHGKRPTEPSQPEQMEAGRKMRYDTTLFSSVEDYQQYKQKFAQRKVIPGRSINFSQL